MDHKEREREREIDFEYFQYSPFTLLCSYSRRRRTTTTSVFLLLFSSFKLLSLFANVNYRASSVSRASFGSPFCYIKKKTPV